jgi:hypothetical protein
LAAREQDVRDVCPNRTPRSDRARQRGSSDTLDAERIARETLAHPLLAHAFKSARAQAAPDEQHELLCLWHNQRRSLLKSRQHLLSEAEFLLADLPLEVRERLPDSKAVRPRLAALRRRDRRCRWDAETALRLRMLDDHRAQIARLDAAERDATKQLQLLVAAADTTLGELRGLSTRSVAELLVEVGDPHRFTEGGFARFNGGAPLAASTAEGPANRSATASTPPAAAASTPSCTAWPSPSCAASRAPRRSPTTPAPAATPNARRGASSRATSQTSSTAA